LAFGLIIQNIQQWLHVETQFSSKGSWGFYPEKCIAVYFDNHAGELHAKSTSNRSLAGQRSSR